MDVSCVWAFGEMSENNVMNKDKIYDMPFSRVYGLLVDKAVRKGRTRDEVDCIMSWFTGYGKDEISGLAASQISYADFFENAPELNSQRYKITGRVCGVKVEEIDEPLMQEIRRVDKLVDELAAGKSMDKILRK